MTCEGYDKCGQVTKSIWWMPRRDEAMKDVGNCDKSWGAVNRALIQEFPNGETRQINICHLHLNS